MASENVFKIGNLKVNTVLIMLKLQQLSYKKFTEFIYETLFS